MTTLFFGGWQVPYLHADGFYFPWGGHIAMANLPVVILAFCHSLPRLLSLSGS